jgi:DNA polymerase (family 10)
MVDHSSQTRDVNRRVAEVFDQIAELLALEGANPFRVRAYRNAARVLRGLSRDVAAILAEGGDLTELPGIGDDLACKIREIVATQESRMLAELHTHWPPTLHALMRLPGLGPKRVRALHESLGVCTLADLAAAVRAGKIHRLPGFGIRTEQRLRAALAGGSVTTRRFALDVARPVAERLVSRLRGVVGVTEVVVAGSYRRARATVGDIDLLVVADPPAPVLHAFVGSPDVARVLASGATRAAVLLRSGLQVDLRVVARESLGAALHYFTGSKAHNIAVRRLARAQGFKLNEYGVFYGERQVAGDTEESVFDAVGLPFIPPELREDRGEIDAARTGRLPTLITADVLRGDVVVVPPALDAGAAVEAAAVAARARGLSYLVVLHEVPVRASIDLPPRLQAAARAAADLGLGVVQAVEIDLLRGALPGVTADLTAARITLDGSGREPARAPLSGVAPALLRVLVRADVAEDWTSPAWLSPLIAGRVLPFIGAPDQLQRLEPLLRVARAAGARLLLGSGGESNPPARLDLAVGQARRAWIDEGSVLNTAPLPGLRSALSAAASQTLPAAPRARDVSRPPRRAGESSQKARPASRLAVA